MGNDSDLNIGYENVINILIGISVLISISSLFIDWTYEYNKKGCNRNYGAGFVFILLSIIKVGLSLSDFIVLNYAKTDKDVLISRII